MSEQQAGLTIVPGFTRGRAQYQIIIKPSSLWLTFVLDHHHSDLLTVLLRQRVRCLQHVWASRTLLIGLPENTAKDLIWSGWPVDIWQGS